MKNIQSLYPVRKFLKSYLKRNKNASLKKLFKLCRELESVSFIGDWPMINEIVYECAKREKFFEKDEVAKVLRLTDDSFLNSQRSDSQLVAILSNKEELRASIQED